MRADLVSFHLQLFARTVVELLGKETMRASHVADARDQNIEKYGRDRPSNHYARVPFENLFCRKIHYFAYLFAAAKKPQVNLPI